VRTALSHVWASAGTQPSGISKAASQQIRSTGKMCALAKSRGLYVWKKSLNHRKRVVFPSGIRAGLSLTMLSWMRLGERGTEFAEVGR
jgi:hypothetical protein